MRMDIVSGDEELISGSDDVDTLLSGYNIVGAVPRGAFGTALRPGFNPGMMGQYAGNRASNYRNALGQAAAWKQAQAGFLVRPQLPTRARRLVLPLASTGTVAAAASATITSRPQTIAFKPQRVTIPATIAPDFTIEDIKVGNTSQLVQSGSLPAEAFVQQSFDIEMDMDTVQTSQDFVIQCTNISGAARTFRAAVFGRSAA